MDFFTPSLDRFPDVPEPPLHAVCTCSHCGEPIWEGETCLSGTDKDDHTFRICENCYSDLTKAELFLLMGGVRQEARKE